MKYCEPGLLEKLFDDDPRQPSGPVFLRLSPEAYKASVARDLEALLNSRATIAGDDFDQYPESRRSILNYGLIDFGSFSRSSSVDRDHICRAIAGAIGAHEPRLREVSVSVEQASDGIGALRFTIRALLVMRPSAEPVNFDAVLMPSTQSYRVAQKGA